MTEQNIKSKVLSSLFWKLMERGGTQGIQFIVQIVLARLLLPEEFGIIALVAIFISIANVFVQSGFNTALIQKKHVDNIDYSSVFYLSLFVSSILYLILYLVAPMIASFYQMPTLISVIKILALTLFLGAVNSVQNAVVARNMQFKQLFISSLISMLLSGALGIAMAYSGLGIWALVMQQLLNQLLIIIILWFKVKWRPKLLFSFERVKALFSYGWKILISSLIDNIYQNIQSLIIGKMYNPNMLGFYNRGKQFPELIVANLNGSIQSVMLPAFASQQDNTHKFKDMVRRSIVTSSFLVFPTMVGLAVMAEPLVTILLTEKWLPAVPFLQIYCISFALSPIHAANLQAINALGRSDIFLKLEIIKKSVGLLILSISVFYGVYAIALGVAVSSFVSSFINAYPNHKLLNYSYREQWKDIMPSIILSLVMGTVIYSIQCFGMSAWITLILQICLGIAIYFGLAKVFRLECFAYLVLTVNKFVYKRNK